jgi:hypothetical protein
MTPYNGIQGHMCTLATLRPDRSCQHLHVSTPASALCALEGGGGRATTPQPSMLRLILNALFCSRSQTDFDRAVSTRALRVGRGDPWGTPRYPIYQRRRYRKECWRYEVRTLPKGIRSLFLKKNNKQHNHHQPRLSAATTRPEAVRHTPGTCAQFRSNCGRSCGRR